MFITLVVLLFGSHTARCNLTLTTHKPDSNKDTQLVNLLKKDLRRNNDDYIDRLDDSKPFTGLNKQTGAAKVAKTNDKQANFYYKPDKHDKDNRRAVDFSDEVDYNKYSFSPSTGAPITPTDNTRSFQTVTPVNTRQPGHDYPKYVNKDKADKFKQFMDKNKNLIQHFIDKKKEARTEAMPATVGFSGSRGEDRVKQEGGTIVQRAGEMVQRAKSSEKYRVPGPRELDMSPAKGGRIHAIRIKGRLCQRNVLVPEGPKYDSRGRVYLPPYAPAPAPAQRHKDYARTRPPKLILPKCCNCCKKSVLGCE